MADATIPTPAGRRALSQRNARIVRNVLALGFSQIFTLVSSAGLAVLLPRYLGDVNLGKLAFALALTSFMGLAVRLGSETYVTKVITRSPELTSHLTVNLITLRLALIAVMAVALVIITETFFQDPLMRATLYWIGVATALDAIASSFFAVLQGLEDMRPVALAQAVGKAIMVSLIAIAFARGGGLVAVAALWSLTSVVSIVVSALALRRHARLIAPIQLAAWRAVAVGGFPYLMWQASLIVYGQVDVLFIKVFATDAVNGWYAAAYRVVTVPVFIPAIIMTAAFPALAAAGHNDPRRLDELGRWAFHIALVLTVPIAAVMIAAPDDLVALLGYHGTEADRAATLISILALHIPLMAGNMILGTIVIATDRHRAWAAVGVSAAVLNPLLNVLLIPATQAAYGNGGLGAAISTVLTEVFLTGAAIVLVPRSMVGSETMGAWARCLLAGALAAGTAWLLPISNFFAVAGTVGVVYGGTALALGVVRIDDFRQLIAMRFPSGGGTDAPVGVVAP